LFLLLKLLGPFSDKVNRILPLHLEGNGAPEKHIQH